MLHRRRNPYSEAIYPALVAIASGPLRMWLQARAVDVDRVIGEATDDLLLGALSVGEQAERARAKVEAAVRAHPGVAQAGIADLALGRYGRLLAHHLLQLEGGAYPYRWNPFPLDFSQYARQRWTEATQGRDVAGSVEQAQTALSRIGPYILEIQKGYNNWRAIISSGEGRPVYEVGGTRKGALFQTVTSRSFGEKIADTQLKAAGFDEKSVLDALGVSRGGIRRLRRQAEQDEALRREVEAERRERESRNLATARDFLARTAELHAALEKSPEIKDLRGLKKALPPGFEANRSELGTAKSYNVRFDSYFWRGDGAMSPDRAIQSLRYYVSRVARMTPQEVVKERQSSYPSTHWHLPLNRESVFPG